MTFWSALFDVAVLLAMALVLGSLCERFRQSAILGYLLAGTLLGPNALNVISPTEEVEGLAEVGVSLLLFTIGLEFSWKRLLGLGRAALVGGALQIVLTMLAVIGAAVLLGLSIPAAVVIGAAFSLSSTAAVLRALMARSEVDSVYGRHAIGILLFQDLAVVPLVILSGIVATGDVTIAALESVGWKVLMLLVLTAGLYVVFNILAPRILAVTALLRNRELPVLFATVGAIGSTWVAHRLEISPAVGAFVAGMLLAESPFATQVRADLSMLRTLLVTLFFSSVGMLANPAWMLEHAGTIVLVAGGVVIGKAFLAAAALRLARQPLLPSVATGVCLAQVGEFAFVISESARGNILEGDLFLLMVSVMMVTLFLTPPLVAQSWRLSRSIVTTLSRAGLCSPVPGPQASDRGTLEGHVLLVGYGPAGEAVADALARRRAEVVVVDLNPRLVRKARERGLEAHIGDATHPEVLDHVHVSSAAAVIVSVPDPSNARSIVRLARAAAPRAPILARARYHMHRDWIVAPGATFVVDEESEVGERLAEQFLKLIASPLEEPDAAVRDSTGSS